MTENLVRAVVVVMLVGASAAKAADISGTLSATFEGVNEFRVPSVKLDLNLACALTCPPSAPTLHYGVAGGVAGKFAGDPTTTAGYSSAFFGSDPTGVTSTVTTSFPTGSAFFVQAKSATCWCGNANGQGGFIDLQTGTVTIPPRMLLDATGKLTDTMISPYASAVSYRPLKKSSVAIVRLSIRQGRYLSGEPLQGECHSGVPELRTVGGQRPDPNRPAITQLTAGVIVGILEMKILAR